MLATPHVGWAGPATLVNDAHTLLEGVANAIRSWRTADTASEEPPARVSS